MKTKINIKLLPCPFCNSESEMEEWEGQADWNYLKRYSNVTL